MDELSKKTSSWWRAPPGAALLSQPFFVATQFTGLEAST